MRKVILFILFFVTGIFALEKRPNILFIFSDDHSLQTLGAHKGRMQAFIKEHGVTPNLDKLAAEGMYFENSFVCNSICGPSRAAILTGKHSWHNGVKSNGSRFNPKQWTMPQSFQKAGYETAIFGKWHLQTTPVGFDVHEVLPGQGKYYNPDFLLGKKRIREEGYCTDIVADKTIAWLKEKRDKNKPFFLCSWQKAPHRTWMPHPRHFEFLDKVKIPEPASLFDSYGGRSSALLQQNMTIDKCINLHHDVKVTPPVAVSDLQLIADNKMVKRTASMDGATFGEFMRMDKAQRQAWDDYYVPRNEKFRAQNLTGKELVRWKYQQYLKDYMRCVKALDENVGRILSYLKESGLDKNTIVIYSSDQGFYNGEHGWYDKRWMYEESLRNPLIIKWPGVTKAGSRETRMVQNIDYAATLLDCADIKVPVDVQGKSFKSILEGKQGQPWRQELLYTYYGSGAHNVKSHYGVRTNRYKLIHFQKTNEWEFYDLHKDKDEMNNLYKNKEYSPKISELKLSLKSLLEKYEVKVN
jgi:arylsulfatase A-like enzyme